MDHSTINTLKILGAAIFAALPLLIWLWWNERS